MGSPKAVIVVVEEDESNRDLFAVVLGLAGYEVTVASTGDDALDVANASKPDLVLIASSPRGLDGLALCRAFRDSHPDAALILVSDLPVHASDLARVPRSSDIAVLTKPFYPERLVKDVKRALRVRVIAAAQRARANAASTKREALELRATIESTKARTQELLNRIHLVLVVEDDKAYGYVTRKHLREAGLRAIEADSLAGAERILNAEPRIDAIVSDIVLPDGDAPPALERLHAAARLPILYITSFPPDRWMHYGLSEDDPRVLAKPFAGHQLIQHLAEISQPRA